MTSTASMPATRVCSSTSISRTPRPSRRSGARSSRAAIPPSSATLPGLARPARARCPRTDGNGQRDRRRAGARRRPPRRLPPPTPAAAAPTPSCSAASPRRWRSSRPTGCTVISRRGSTRSASEPIGDPALDPLRLEPKLTPELQARIPASVLRVHVDGETLAEALPRLKETYCGSMAYEIEHISDHEQRVWLRKAIESWRFRTPLDAEEQRRLYARLCEVEGMERYLRRSFLGQKQFSLEGLDVLIPMLDEALELARRRGRARGRARHGAPRAAQRPRAHDRHAVRADPARVRGRARRSRSSPPTPRAAPATSSTTSAPKGTATPPPARSRSRSPRIRATSRRSTPSSRG